MSNENHQNRDAVWGKHSDSDRMEDHTTPHICSEDAEAMPEILAHLESIGRIDIVVDWLEKRGHIQGSRMAETELLRPVFDMALAAGSDGEMRLVLECQALVLNLQLKGESKKSITKIAQRFGITKQSVKRRIDGICKRLNITSTIVSKSKSASEQYKLHNHRNETKP